MSEGQNIDTPVAGETVQPVNTDTEVVNDHKSDVVDTPKAPSVEHKEGKMFVDGVRVYSRDDTNRIAANAKKDVESRILSDLDVDSIDQVKQVVTELRNASPENNSLDVEALRSAVQKREATVEELKAELSKVKTDYAVKEHVSTLKDNMPTSWKTEQKDAVVDLMKARNMLLVEGETFAIKNGNDYLTVDGEKPDYKTAVEVVGKSLGLPFAKKGVDTFDADRTPQDVSKSSTVNESRLKSDREYNAAYVQVRNANKSLSRDQITDGMIKKHMERTRSFRSTL
mgnify:FL=1|tara:strand:+ start:1237 stop:2088 length:852 start_codon:yes stop_codon:yes gene_type:complete